MAFGGPHGPGLAATGPASPPPALVVLAGGVVYTVFRRKHPALAARAFDTVTMKPRVGGQIVRER